MVNIKSNRVNFSVESFQVEKSTPAKERKEGVTLTGFALPFDTTSRNGFAYRKESVKATASTLEGKPMFFNHDVDSIPIGTVEKINVTDKGLEYVAKLKPVTEEGEKVVEGIKSGLINNVSIQCIYENAKLNEKSNTFEVDVKEFLELSAVTIPGFAETTAMAHEKLTMANKVKEEIAKDVEDEKPTEDESEEQSDEEQVTPESVMEALKEFISENESKMSDMENALSAMQATIDSMVEESKGEDEEESEEQADEEESPEKEEPEKDESEEACTDKEKESEENLTRSTVAPQVEEEVKYNSKDYLKARFGINI